MGVLVRRFTTSIISGADGQVRVANRLAVALLVFGTILTSTSSAMADFPACNSPGASPPCTLGACTTFTQAPGTLVLFPSGNGDQNKPNIQCEANGCTPGATTPCTPCADAGPQAGKITCGTDGTWGSCAILAGILDTCGDGLDNDCDGFIDNGVTCGTRPIIFVPGTLGTRLINAGNNSEEVWPGCPSTTFTELTLDPSQSHPTITSAGPVLDAVAGCDANFAKEFGKDQLTYFTIGGRLIDHVDDFVYPKKPSVSRPEFELSDDHNSYAGNGCDSLSYVGHTAPHVFMWGYDWRNSTDSNAAALKDFIDGCVNVFWPNRQVDIMAHSQGSLVSRRYIIDFPNDHKVRHLATIGGPWLGAAKALYAEATGIEVSSSLVSASTIKGLLPFFPGPQELVPAQPYLDLLSGDWLCHSITLGLPNTCSAYAEQDFLREPSGEVDELPFSTYESAFGIDRTTNTTRIINPVTVAQAFYAKPGQADWTLDTSGVSYLHVFGLQDGLHTPIRTSFGIFYDDNFNPHAGYAEDFGSGDGTVPLLSAGRVGGTFGLPNTTDALNPGFVLPSSPPTPSVDNLNANAPSFAGAPGATLFPVTPAMWAPDSIWSQELGGGGNALVEHTNLTANGLVAQTIFDFFDNDTTPPWPTPRAEVLTSILRISGIKSVLVSDESGTSVDAVAAAQWVHSGNVFPDADAYILPNGAMQLIMSGAHTFTVTLSTLNGITTVTSTNALSQGNSQVVTYRSLALPATGSGQLVVTAAGSSPLKLDLDGDGTYETIPSPTSSVVGQQANDITPPTIQITSDPRIANTYTISASDTSGVRDVIYSALLTM